MLQHRSPPSYDAESGPVYLAVTAKRNTLSTTSDLSRQLSSAYRYDSFKADRVQRLRKHWSVRWVRRACQMGSTYRNSLSPAINLE
ncbi:hypothetical protein TNCV_3819631 [Trichonephila clavipes]|nr:hypothetical protein TNCV_3819631 [Trichonephila clavipes]